jgi:hypothetical protein
MPSRIFHVPDPLLPVVGYELHVPEPVGAPTADLVVEKIDADGLPLDVGGTRVVVEQDDVALRDLSHRLHDVRPRHAARPPATALRRQTGRPEECDGDRRRDGDQDLPGKPSRTAATDIPTPPPVPDRFHKAFGGDARGELRLEIGGRLAARKRDANLSH